MAAKLIARDWDEAAQAIVTTFPDGEKVSYSFASLPDQSKIDCGMHGMEQKIFDSIAGEIKKGTSFEDIRTELQRVYDQLLAGEWKGKRGSSEGPSLTLLAEAVARMFNVTVEVAQEKLGTKTVEERRAMASAPQVKAKIDEIRAERSKAKADRADSTSVEALQGLFT